MNEHDTFQERVDTILNDTFERSVKGVIVLLNKLGCLIANSSGKMSNEESFIVADLAMVTQFGFARQRQSEVAAIGRVNRFRKVARTWFRQLWFLVEDVENAVRLGFNQIDAILIVNIDDLLNAKPFLFVEQLFFLEDAFVEELLQFLVTVVDTELFEAVDGKIFEASDVQHADVVGWWLERNARIDLLHHKVE